MQCAAITFFLLRLKKRSATYPLFSPISAGELAANVWLHPLFFGPRARDSLILLSPSFFRQAHSRKRGDQLPTPPFSPFFP